MFEGLENEDLEVLARELRVHPLVPGDMVFHAGDEGNSMFIVAAGVVDIFLPGLDPSSNLVVATLEAGTYFGEFALFDNQPRSASAQVTSDTVLLELGRDALMRYWEDRPNAALGILRTMSERLRETNAMLGARATRNVVEEYEQGMRWSDRVADQVARLNGSWSFIFVLSAVMVIWALLNVHHLLFGHPPDPYPYIFFNLVLAVLIALQWPLIVMSQNRRAEKERRAAELDFQVNLKNETHCEELLGELRAFRAEWEGREEQLAGLLARRHLGDSYEARDR